MVPLEAAPVKIWVRSQQHGGRVDPEEPRVCQRQGYRNHYETCPGADKARADAKAKRDKQDAARDTRRGAQV